MLILAADGHENPLIPPWPEIIIGLIAIALVFLVLRKFVWPQFERVFAERTEAIEGGLARAAAAQREAEAALKKYQEQLAQARKEAALIRDDARAEGHKIIEEMRAKAQAESDRIVARGGEQLEQQRLQVVTELRQHVGQMSTSLASRIVGEELRDQSRVHGTIDRFLDELDSMAGTGEGSH